VPKLLGWLVVGVAVGVVVVLLGQSFFGKKDDAGNGASGAGTAGPGGPSSAVGSATDSNARRSPGPSLAGADTAYAGEAGRAAGAAAGPVRATGVEPGGLVDGLARDNGRAGANGLPDPSIAFAGAAPTPASFGGSDGFAHAVARADEAIAKGQTRQAVSLLRGLIQQSRGRAGVDLTRQAFELLQLDDDLRTRRECIAYLQERGVGHRAFEEQIVRATVLASATEPDAVRRAWDELSIAYDAALDEAQRERVIPVL
jgi:hypothetical protein